MLADQLQKADVKVCNTPQLKSIDTSELDSNTNEFITQIKINQIKREGIISAIYEYFSHAQDEFYTHKDCIKYDSENGS
ncbi:MAG: hypothetical protein HWD59_15105 [Coxiellaceae bacterium]|nr:MAG: hypothetical protein HWD59_15105 [Coxiellaceae bacterium]